MDYASSGVDIESGNRAVELIKHHVQRTYSPFVLNKLGGFAAHYELPSGYRTPVLVSCTDGVGTKVKLAIESGKLDSVGIDLVAMCVNDMICSGAKPLFFLDYIACHKLVPEQMEQLIKGMTEGCLQAECSLVGGEMAEMNDLYHPGDFDLAGFSVGVVEKELIIDGSKVAEGDYVYGLPSSGVHSNGFSLVRKVMTPEVCARLGITLEALLTPTTIYVKRILSLISTYKIHSIVHITGGGLVENVMRVVPEHAELHIQKSQLPKLAIFDHIQKEGQVSDSEMFKVFNMGIGMVVISPDRLLISEDLILLGRVKLGKKNVILV